MKVEKLRVALCFRRKHTHPFYECARAPTQTHAASLSELKSWKNCATLGASFKAEVGGRKSWGRQKRTSQGGWKRLRLCFSTLSNWLTRLNETNLNVSAHLTTLIINIIPGQTEREHIHETLPGNNSPLLDTSADWVSTVNATAAFKDSLGRTVGFYPLCSETERLGGEKIDPRRRPQLVRRWNEQKQLQNHGAEICELMRARKCVPPRVGVCLTFFYFIVIIFSDVNFVKERVESCQGRVRLTGRPVIMRCCHSSDGVSGQNTVKHSWRTRGNWEGAL